MGVERAVTRWYIHRQIVLTEIEMLSAKLVPALIDTPDEAGIDAVPPEAINIDEITQQLARAQEKLHLLGPCPKPMMG